MADRSVVWDLIARDRASDAFGSVGDSADKTGSKLAGFGKVVAVGMAAAGAAVVGVGAALFKLGGSFDEQFDKIQVGTGKTGEELEGLQDSFKNVLKSVPTDFAGAGEAITSLNQKLGLSGPPLEAMSKQLINLSRITETDLAGNVKVATDLFNNFGIKVADQPAKLDALFRASQASGLGVDALAGTMTAAGPILRQVGFSFEESAALIAGLGKAGVDAGAVMPALSKAVATAAKDGKSASKLFDDTFAAIKNAPTDTAAAGTAMEVFGAKAGPKLAGLIREGKLSLEDLQAQIAGGKDTINGAAEDTADFAEKWQMFKNKVLVGLEPLATGVFNAVGTAMDKLGPVFDRVSSGIGRVSDAIKGIMDGNLASAGVDIGVLFGFDEDSAETDKIIRGLEGIKAGFADAMENVKAVVSGALDGLRDFWAQHHEEIMGVLNQLRDTFDSAFGAVKAIIDTFVKVATELWERFGATLTDKLRIAFEAITEILHGALAVLGGVFDLIKAVLTGKWGEAWDALKQIVVGAFEAIKGLFRLGLDALALVFEAYKAILSAAWSAIWNALKTLLSDAWAGIKAGVSAGLGAVTGFFSNLWSDIKGAIGDIAGKMLQIGKDIIGGIAKGIEDAAHEVIDAMQEFVLDKLPGFVKDFFGIGSPSKMFAEIGGNLMEGLGKGIKDNAYIPLDALKKVNGDILSGVDAALRAGTPGVSFRDGVPYLNGKPFQTASTPASGVGPLAGTPGLSFREGVPYVNGKPYVAPGAAAAPSFSSNPMDSWASWSDYLYAFTGTTGHEGAIRGLLHNAPATATDKYGITGSEVMANLAHVASQGGFQPSVAAAAQDLVAQYDPATWGREAARAYASEMVLQNRTV